MSTLGIRNNNPLNIRYSKSNDWKGQTGSNKGFCVFDSMQNGLRAGFITLRSYSKRGINTVRSIVNTFAPASDGNNPEGYVRFITDRTGINADSPLQFNFETYSEIVREMAVIESRYAAPPDELRRAWDSI